MKKIFVVVLCFSILSFANTERVSLGFGVSKFELPFKNQSSILARTFSFGLSHDLYSKKKDKVILSGKLSSSMKPEEVLLTDVSIQVSLLKEIVPKHSFDVGVQIMKVVQESISDIELNSLGFGYVLGYNFDVSEVIKLRLAYDSKFYRVKSSQSKKLESQALISSIRFLL